MFNWVMLIPLTQFYSDLIAGRLSYLGYVGLITTYVTSMYTSFSYRNTQFMEYNRRKSTPMNYINLSVLFMGIVLGNAVEEVIRLIFLVLLVIEYILYFPIPDPKLSQFYFMGVCAALSSCILVVLQFEALLVESMILVLMVSSEVS